MVRPKADARSGQTVEVQATVDVPAARLQRGLGDGSAVARARRPRGVSQGVRAAFAENRAHGLHVPFAVNIVQLSGCALTRRATGWGLVVPTLREPTIPVGAETRLARPLSESA